MTTLNETLQAFTKLGSIFRRRNGQKRSGKTNGATCFLSCILTKTGETPYTDLAVCAYTDLPAGVLMELADDANDLSKDASDPIDDNINVVYCSPEINDEFIVTLAEGEGCTYENLAVVSSAADGFVESMSPTNESIAAVPPFRIIGKFLATLAIVSGKARHAWVKKI